MVNSPLVRLWRDTMTVTVKQPYKRQDKSTGFNEVNIIENEPCKVSFVDNMAYNQLSDSDGVASPLKKVVKLFCSAELNIPAGSKIAIIHNGETINYTHSSQPSVFTHHQEILLDLLEKWA
jgi:hypothetical protein